VITLVAAVSAGGFIADAEGHGDFSSAEDKADFRAYLRSDACDGFIAGRRTADEVGSRLTYKPLYVLTRTAAVDWRALSAGRKLALLGGAQAYLYFLENGLVDYARITTERSMHFGSGLVLPFFEFIGGFSLVSSTDLSQETALSIYAKL
jgi:dihydrofolate reductase